MTALKIQSKGINAEMCALRGWLATTIGLQPLLSSSFTIESTDADINPPALKSPMDKTPGNVIRDRKAALAPAADRSNECSRSAQRCGPDVITSEICCPSIWRPDSRLIGGPAETDEGSVSIESLLRHGIRLALQQIATLSTPVNAIRRDRRSTLPTCPLAVW